MGLASHADVLRGSSRVPAPVRGAGTRDEPLRTSAWEAIESIPCEQWLLPWTNHCSQGIESRILSLNLCAAIFFSAIFVVSKTLQNIDLKLYRMHAVSDPFKETWSLYFSDL